VIHVDGRRLLSRENQGLFCNNVYEFVCILLFFDGECYSII